MVRSPSRRRPSAARNRASFGPLVGMRDSLDPSVSNDPKFAFDLENVRPIDLKGPTTFVGRPGFEKMYTPVPFTPLGAAGARTGQLVHHFVREDGVERTVLVVGGHWYWRNWAGETASHFSEATAGGVTWDTTSRYYAATFGDIIVYHDGTNTPRTKDPISLSGAALTNAPIFYGQPVVYYAKLFAIKNAERSVMVWSEENDPTIGYEMAAYDNSWQIGQTDQEPLFALAATNEALYYFRARSIGAVYGAVTSEFTTAGTHEGISQTQGTVSPDGVCGVGEKVYFIDADARPSVIIPGAGAKALDENIRETIAGLDTTQLNKAITRFDPVSGLVLFGVVEIGQSQPSCIIAINPVLDIPVAVWRGFTFSALGIVKDGNGDPIILHLSDDGYAYQHGTIDGDQWDDAFVAGTLPIAHAVETCHLAADSSLEKRFHRSDLLLRVEDDATTISTRIRTPYAVSDLLEATYTRTSGALWDAFNWDDDPMAPDAVEGHLSVGYAGRVGRWARVRIEHEEDGERFGFARLTLEHTPAGNAAGAL